MRSKPACHGVGRPAWLAALLVCAVLTPGSARPETQPVPEHHMKAAYVFNFAVFTEWPPEALAGGVPLALCASADSPLYAALKELKDKPINGHPVTVRSSAGPLRGCHVLVLDRGDRERWPRFKRDLAGSAVLTVADDHVIGADGAIIVLANLEQRIAFDIDLEALRGARLGMSSKLLRLARSVQ